MFKPSPENPESSSSSAPGWLSEMQAASASSLQASVFYQAGYEAARQELKSSAWRRASVVAIAASLIVTSVSGAFLFQLGRQNGQTIAVSNRNQQRKPTDAPERDLEWKVATTPTQRDAPVDGNRLLKPSWIQSQLSRMLPIANTRIRLLGPAIELGQRGADLDKIIFMDSPTNPNSRTTQSVEDSHSTEPQSLRSMRDNRIKALMESLL
jgi:hypothetical protein